MLNADFTQKEQLELLSKPWDLSLTETDEIVLSQPGAKSLLFMKVIPHPHTGSSVTLDQSCYGVAVQDGWIHVSFGNGEIRVIDRSATEKYLQWISRS